VLSKQHERKFSGDTRQTCSRLVQEYSAFSQPTFGTVLLLGEFSRQLQNFFIDFSLAAIRGQGLRESFGQIVPNINPLDAALVQQTASRSALSCACDFAVIDHHVCTHRGCETIVAGIADGGSARRNRRTESAGGIIAAGYNRTLPRFSQRSAQGAMDLLID
jgi:hypothetical protein